MSDAGISLRQALTAIGIRLTAAGIERGRAEARLLAGHALGVPLESVVGNDDRILSAAERRQLDELATRRERREPMAQILGQREFFGRDFKVTADVLTPRADSETLIEAVLSHLPDRSASLRILELGVGSGCLLLTLLAELPNARGIGVDISAAALAVARHNAALLQIADRAHLEQGDWSRPVEGLFDLLISNPPYIPSSDIAGLEPEVAQFEPALALDGGSDGLAFYRRIGAELGRLLQPRGLVALEVGEGQASQVAAILQNAGLTVLERRRDLAGIERCVVANKS